MDLKDPKWIAWIQYHSPTRPDLQEQLETLRNIAKGLPEQKTLV